MSKTAVISGVNGQLGQYLVKYLLDNEPEITVIGTVRHKSYDDQEYIFDKNRIKFELMDLMDPHSIENLILKYKPDYFINTAANAFVGDSWALPVQHMEFNAIGVLHQLEAIKKHSPHTRYFNMGTSEEFAVSEVTGPQNENTKIYPKSPYGAAKAAARYLVSIYRNSFGLYAIQGWTFNFESKLRGEKYVTRKITKGVARIFKALNTGKSFEPIELGNIYSSRSWQHASDVAEGIWLQLNQDRTNKKLKDQWSQYCIDNGLAIGSMGLSCMSDEQLNAYNTRFRTERAAFFAKNIKEYVLSSTDTHLVKDFVDAAFEVAGIGGEWSGTGINEKKQLVIYDGHEARKVDLVTINSKFYRPLDVTYLYGDPAKIKAELGWNPQFNYQDIIKEMVEHDIAHS
jgi:GDPmannose 4,6-dehydratase